MDTPMTPRLEESVSLPFFVRFLEARTPAVIEVDAAPTDARDGDPAALICPSERDAG